MSYQDSTDPELQEYCIWLSSNVIKASGGRHGGSGGSRIEVERMAKAYCGYPDSDELHVADPADEVDRLLADPEISSLKSLNGGRRS